MPFIHPGIFWTGLAAVSVPIIIHILSRRRFRTVHWAAMRFLMESLRRNRRRLRIEELILLALRCLIILALTAVVARFIGCGRIAPFGGNGAAMNVFILDDSCSMGQKFGSGEVFATAAEELIDRIESLGKSERCAIILATGDPDDSTFFAPARVGEIDLEGLSGRIASLEPAGRRADLSEAIKAAEGIFANAPGTKRLYIVGDFRKIDLSAPSTHNAMREQFSRISSADVEVIALDYARKPRNNLTVERIELLDGYALAGQPVRIGVSVRNNSPDRVENVEVRLSASVGAYAVKETTEGDETLSGDIKISTPVEVIDVLLPGESKRVQWRLLLPSAAEDASAVVRAHLPADELSGDNTAHLAIDIRPAIKVLLVDGRLNVSASAEENESFFMAQALAPKSSNTYGNSMDVVSPEDFGQVNLPDYHAVILLNVASLADGTGNGRRLEALEQYVRAGGGLAIFMGDKVNESFYNGPLYKEGRGLLPFRIGKIVRAASKDSEIKYFRLAPKSIAADSLLSVFTGEGSIALKLIRIFAFRRADEAAGSSSGQDVTTPRVLARFSDASGSPAVVSRRFGNGRVVVFYTSAHKRWTDWPIDPFGTFVVVANQMIRRIARSQPEGKTAFAGAPIVFEPPEAMRDAEAWLETPGNTSRSSVRLKTQIRDGEPVLSYEHTADSGVYNLWLRDPAGRTTRIPFARNIEPSEGDLMPGGRESLEAAFGSDEFHYQNRPGEAGEMEFSIGGDYWTWMLAAMLVFMAFETILGRRFGHYS